MIPILDVLPYLTAFPYAFIYYFILIVSVLLAFLQTRKHHEVIGTHLKIALWVILGCQLALLSLSVIAFQGHTLAASLFPPVQRTLTLICIVWIIAAVLNPSFESWTGYLPWALSLGAIVAGGLTAFLWIPYSTLMPFNRSWLDLTWTGFSLLILLIGFLLLVRQKQKSRLTAFAVLLLSMLGLVIQLLLPPQESMPAAVMLSQLVYYPLLISLVVEQASIALASQPARGPFHSAPILSAQQANALLGLSLQQDESSLKRALSHSLGLYLMADLCGIVEQKESKGELRVSHLYDLIREEFLPDFSLNPTPTSLVSNSFEEQKPLIINVNSPYQQERKMLQNAIAYNQLGSVLLYPFLMPEHPSYGLVCLTPYTNKPFGALEVEQLGQLQSNIIKVLSKASSFEEKLRTAELLKQTLSQMTIDKAQLTEHLTRSQAMLEEANANVAQLQSDRSEEASLWVQRQQSLETELEQLTETMQQHQEILEQADTVRVEKEELDAALQQNLAQIQKVRQALDNARSVLEGMDDKEGAEPDQKNKVEEVSAGPELFETPFVSTSSAPYEQDLRSEIASTASAFSNRSIIVHTDIHDLPEVEESVRELLSEILKLMQTNAIEASPNDSSISIEIFANPDTENGGIELRVTDHGGGLSKLEQAHLLRFAKSASHPVPAGIGDAAALRKAIQKVRAAGGHLWIQSNKDQPTTYRVSLPVNTEKTDSAK